MAVQIQVQPRGGSQGKGNFKTNQTSSLKGLAGVKGVLALGELARVKGLLEGLCGLGIQGTLSAVIHEGLYQVSGTLVIFNPQHQSAIEAIVAVTEISVAGLAALYPQLQFRLDATYNFQWT